MGSFLLNWGILVLGLFLFIFGTLFVVQYGKAYKSSVMRHGRFKHGKEYGKSWDKSDTVGASGTVISWIFIIPAIIGAVLFFFTSLPEIGMPLWIGTTLGIAGVILFFIASIGGMGIAQRDVEIAFRHKLENEEQRRNDSTT